MASMHGRALRAKCLEMYCNSRMLGGGEPQVFLGSPQRRRKKWCVFYRRGAKVILKEVCALSSSRDDPIVLSYCVRGVCRLNKLVMVARRDCRQGLKVRGRVETGDHVSGVI